MAEAIAVFEFRVTKYDPIYRNAAGIYTRHDWTSYSDIGRTFSGSVLTLSEYECVEDAYVAAAVALLSEAGVSALAVTGLENRAAVSLAIGEGSLLDVDGVGQVLRGVLRQAFWCRFECGQAFVHVGWDYYMYVGVPSRFHNAVAAVQGTGLFVERFRSPYNVGRSAAAT